MSNITPSEELKELHDLESLLLRLTKTIRKSIPKKGKTGGLSNKRWRKKFKTVETRLKERLKGKIKQKSTEPAQELASPNPIE